MCAHWQSQLDVKLSAGWGRVNHAWGLTDDTGAAAHTHIHYVDLLKHRNLHTHSCTHTHTHTHDVWRMNAIFSKEDWISSAGWSSQQQEWDSCGYIGSIKALISSTILWTNFNQAFISVDYPRTEINSIRFFLLQVLNLVLFCSCSIFFFSSASKLILAVTRAHPP